MHVGKKIVGLGGKVHQHMPLSSRQFLGFLRLNRAHNDSRRHSQLPVNDNREPTDHEDSENILEWEAELSRWERKVQAELDNVREQEQLLRKMQSDLA